MCSHSGNAHNVHPRRGCIFCGCQEFTVTEAPAADPVRLGKYAVAALDLLAANPVFGRLPKPALMALLKDGRGRIVRDGTVLAGAGARSGMFHVVLQGQVVVEQHAPGRSLRHVVNRGGVAGELAALSQRPRESTVYAHGDAIVLELDVERLSAVLEAVPGLFGVVVQAFARFTADLDERVRLTFELMSRYLSLNKA